MLHQHVHLPSSRTTHSQRWGVLLQLDHSNPTTHHIIQQLQDTTNNRAPPPHHGTCSPLLPVLPTIVVCVENSPTVLLLHQCKYAKRQHSHRRHTNPHAVTKIAAASRLQQPFDIPLKNPLRTDGYVASSLGKPPNGYSNIFWHDTGHADGFQPSACASAAYVQRLVRCQQSCRSSQSATHASRAIVSLLCSARQHHQTQGRRGADAGQAQGRRGAAAEPLEARSHKHMERRRHMHL
jgi:hypothetical protein